MKLNILKFNVEFIAKDKIHLPEFSGSTFRGVFGHALKQLSCMNLNENCNLCDLSNQCIYSNIFETKPPEGDIPPFNGMNYIPHPFILRPNKGVRKSIGYGHLFNVELIIFGKFAEWTHIFLKALQNTGRIGVGNGMGKYALNKITDINSNRVVYVNDKWIEESSLKQLTLERKAVPAIFQLKLKTPLRIIKNKIIIKRLTPITLFKEASRRYKLLTHYYGIVDKDYDYHEIIEGAKRIRYENNTIMKRLSRYSNRQLKFIDIDGLLGTIMMEKVPSKNYALLKVLEDIHIGKGASMGLGQIEIIH